ncbi:hypothetical protein SBX64_15975 [Vibrio rhizosphaerae]|uniref:CR-type domain-containing protein n=1 Tax=Vibrio rhizosphaerae TaxID=398736 RepID=A0ABU4IXA4_9VIBR|nr:TIGR02642 family protein [Vibrio rhizosphaerae]MDW6094037.1 hypothetical protein [Vibrio rhizosphaerae]
MSDKAIELFIRMHLEKTPTMQRGRQTLTGDVIMGVMGAMQHQHPFGCDLIMARWMNDVCAVRRIGAYLDRYVDQMKSARSDMLRQLASIALIVFLGRPTNDQVKILSSLYRNHSAQAQRSKRFIKRHNTKINTLENLKESASTRFQIDSFNSEIGRYEKLIDNERQRLSIWAEEQAKQSYKCPVCRGSGSSGNSDCPKCEGKGAFVPGEGNVLAHLRLSGVNVSDKLWNSKLKPAFDKILGMLHQEHDETARLLGKRLEEEKVA